MKALVTSVGAPLINWRLTTVKQRDFLGSPCWG
jgi:hypothetical protein